MEKEYILSIDIGGTNLKSGLVDREGNVFDVFQTPSFAYKGREYILEALSNVIERQRSKGKRIVAVGAGSPGTVNNRTGYIDYMQAHIPNWGGTPLGKYLTDWTGCPSQIDNDVNLIALGENWKGAGRGARCQVTLAMGTGLGSGIVIDGKLLRGAFSNAAELGHSIVSLDGTNLPCTCGNFGCAESFIAPGKIIQRAHFSMQNGIPSKLAGEGLTADAITQLYRANTPPFFTLKEIIELYDEDFLCKRLIDDAMKYLAFLMYNCVKIFDPDVFTLGGGMMKSAHILLPMLERELSRYYFSPELPARYEIKVSELGDDAGLYGSAKMAWDYLDEKRG